MNPLAKYLAVLPIAALLCASLGPTEIAQAATVAVTAGSGTNFLTKQDASSNNASSVTICDAVNPDNCAPVSTSNGLGVVINAGTVTVVPSGTQTVTGTIVGDILGNAGGAMDAAGTNAAAPANELQVGGQYLSSRPGLTTGHVNPLELDSAGNLFVNINAGTVAATQSGTWTGVTIVPSGTQTVTGTVTGNVAGHAGGAFDAAGNVAAPANELIAGGEYLSSPPTLSTGTVSPLLMDNVGNLLIKVNAGTVAAAQSGNWTTTLAAGGTVAITGTPSVQGTLAANQSGNWLVQGAAASGSAASGNPLLGGGRAQNAEPTAVANGNAEAWALDLVGRGIVFPYANKENIEQGATSATGTVAATLVAAAGAGVKNYVTSAQCFRSDAGTTTAYVTLSDSASTTIVLPAGGGSNVTFPLPLATAANTALTFTASAAISTVYCNAQGFKGT